MPFWLLPDADALFRGDIHLVAVGEISYDPDGNRVAIINFYSRPYIGRILTGIDSSADAAMISIHAPTWGESHAVPYFDDPIGFLSTPLHGANLEKKNGLSYLSS